MSSCGCNSNVDQTTTAATKKPQQKVLEIELLYLDLEVCDPCQATDASLLQALQDADHLLRDSGYLTNLKKVHITSPDLAIKHQFISSPTIRINGDDIQLDVRESLCPSCSSLTQNESVNCRVWVHQGEEYKAPPKEMIIQSILQHVHNADTQMHNKSNQDYVLPDNLKRFFAAKKDPAASTCC